MGFRVLGTIIPMSFQRLTLNPKPLLRLGYLLRFGFLEFEVLGQGLRFTGFRVEAEVWSLG